MISATRCRTPYWVDFLHSDRQNDNVIFLCTDSRNSYGSTARSTGLINEIDRRVHLLKVHAPYQESDRVMAHVLNMLCGGTRLEHLELLRYNEALLNAVGADSIPDPTTAGDFCRRFMADDLDSLTSAIHAARLNVWRQQPDQFFNEAIINVDGVIVGTTGECKEGMDISYKKICGYHPLLVSFANTKEVLATR